MTCVTRASRWWQTCLEDRPDRVDRVFGKQLYALHALSIMYRLKCTVKQWLVRCLQDFTRCKKESVIVLMPPVKILVEWSFKQYCCRAFVLTTTADGTIECSLASNVISNEVAWRIDVCNIQYRARRSLCVLKLTISSTCGPMTSSMLCPQSWGCLALTLCKARLCFWHCANNSFCFFKEFPTKSLTSMQRSLKSAAEASDCLLACSWSSRHSVSRDIASDRLDLKICRMVFDRLNRHAASWPFSCKASTTPQCNYWSCGSGAYLPNLEKCRIWDWCWIFNVKSSSETAKGCMLVRHI